MPMPESMNQIRLSRLREIFDSFDTDHSGNISEKELSSVLKAMNIAWSEEEVKKIMTAVDFNQTGTEKNSIGHIDFHEFVLVMLHQQYPMPTEQELRNIFRKFDLDNSGFIEAKEIRAVLKSMGQNLAEADVNDAVKALDRNRDGKISFDEFAKFFRK